MELDDCKIGVDRRNEVSGSAAPVDIAAERATGGSHPRSGAWGGTPFSDVPVSMIVFDCGLGGGVRCNFDDMVAK